MSGLRSYLAAGLITLIVPAAAMAQTMRFETSVGNIDMQLNPTNDPNLQPLVDNMVAYIGLGRYHYTSINRAAPDFVLQMGSFLGFPPTTNDFLGLIQEINRLDPVIVDADNNGAVDFNTLSNTRGTVSLALSNSPNSGTSSFFINLADNSGLDDQGFVPFARINDMTAVDRIMDLQTTSLTGNPNDLTFSDVPLLDNGRMVVIRSVRVLQAAPEFSFVGPVQAALEQIQQSSSQAALAALSSTSIASAAAALTAEEAPAEVLAETPDAGSVVPAATPAAVNAVPEPSSALLAGLALLAASRFSSRRRS
jgi:peptidyl-prolyl cis-trans isomerase A (cyclophilin A)